MPSTVGNITNVHTLSHISMGAGGATVLSQLSNVSASPGINLMVSAASGDVYPRFLGAGTQQPEISFQTTQLKTVLDVVSSTNQMWDASANSAVLYFEKSDNLGVRSATNHTSLAMADPLLICTQITAGHRAPAMASCRLVNVYDGTTVPVVPSGAAALAGDKTDAEHYILGGIKIGASFLTNGV